MRVQSAFNMSAGLLMRKFHSVRMDIQKNLFDSMCLPMFRMNLSLCKKKATADHFALNKLFGYPKYLSNHIVCAEFCFLTFKRFFNNRFVKLYEINLNSKSTC